MLTIESMRWWTFFAYSAFVEVCTSSSTCKIDCLVWSTAYIFGTVRRYKCMRPII